MKAFESLALALRGQYHKTFAQLNPAIRRRVDMDFAPWSWFGLTPRQRCHHAKRWDDENDPARREMREGIEALTNPDSPAYSLEETQRLRGDFLPEKRHVQIQKVLPPLVWVEPQILGIRPAPSSIAKESPSARGVRLLKTLEQEVEASGEHGALARVYVRELDINPKADRSNIGKQIKKARGDMADTKKGAGMFRSLVKNGKRVT
ncbi:MAG: hypothetical protein JZU60_02880 [Ilumatobacteraceae bacterium]|jgi:hypothetical protein|nr:hypothetical protein [Ilumatobacteraceae bacterium]